MYLPEQSRLQTQASDTSFGGWAADEDDANPWLQVDLGDIYNIQNIAVTNRDGTSQRVTSYKLALALTDGEDFSFILTQSGQEKIFLGPLTDDEVAAVSINRTDARFVRIYPLTHEEYVSVRWEVYACMEGK